MLTGNAFLALWHDIAEGSMDDYTEWHTREHMPERLSITGFLTGKRLIDHRAARHKIGTIYCGENAETFRSPAYLERLNNPSAWSLEVQPAFRNFLRVACERLATAGLGDGGAIMTIRLDHTGSEDALRAGAGALAERLLALKGVCCAHVGLARPEVSGVHTKETELRPEMSERSFDAIIIVEGSGKPELDGAVSELEAIIATSGLGLSNPFSHVYWLAYELTADDMKSAQ